MKRRQFLRTGGAAALALSGARRYAEAFADTRLRVGVIGAGWYGKCDLFRLVQVAPVEVVSLCDVDSAVLRDAALQVAARQASRKTPRTYADYRAMLAERDLDRYFPLEFDSNPPDAPPPATLDYGDLQVVWTHRYWGATPDPRHPWGATLFGDKGTLEVSSPTSP